MKFLGGYLFPRTSAEDLKIILQIQNKPSEDKLIIIKFFGVIETDTEVV